MLKRGKYIKTVYRPYPPLFFSIMWRGCAHAAYYQGLVDEPYAIANLIEVDGLVYYAKTELDQAKGIVFREWSNHQKLAAAQKLLDKREAGLLASARQDFNSFCAAYERFSPAIILAWQAEEPVEKKMRALLEKRCSPERVDELMNALNIPAKDNLHKREMRELLKARDLAAHVKKYEWIKSRYGEIHPYTIAAARAKLRETDKRGFLDSYREEKEHIKNSIAKAKKLVGAHAGLVDFMQFIVYYRTHRTDTLNRAQYLFIPQLRQMARERRLTYKQLLQCTQDEVLTAPPSRAVLNKRINAHALVLEDGAIRCVIGSEYEAIRVFFQEEAGDVSSLRGAIAHKGVVRGAVKLIFGTQDFGKVQAGDILVTSMTNPHMLPIMKKAAAFVTDEGGITCHAAILSREMKKPCIIGTRIATKVFKDGDRVEVDADKGVVRKIK